MTDKTYIKELGIRLPSSLFANAVTDVAFNAPVFSPYEVWLKIGQSNSVGTDGTGPIDYFGEDSPNSRVLEVSRGTNKEYFAAPVNELMLYKQPGQDDGTGIGFGQMFGKERVKLNVGIKELAVVNRGVGGTGFAGNRWNKGNDLYEAAVLQVNQFLEKHPHYKFAGFVWHQGESDAGNAENADAYAVNLTAMVDNMRIDITGGADAPFVCGTMVQSWIGTDVNRLTVDAVHRNVSDYISNSTFADFSEMTDFQDSIHFGTGSLREMGKIYAHKHQELAYEMNQSAPAHMLTFDTGEVVDKVGGGRVYDPVFVYDAERGSVLKVDGTGFKTDLVINSDAYTKACWFKRDSAPSGFNNIISCAFGSGITDAHFWGLGGAGHDTVSGIGGNLNSVISAIGVWDHLAATYDGSEFKIYVNSVEVATSTGAAELLTQKLHGVELGSLNGASGCDARLDEVVILPYAASAETIATLAGL